MAKKRNKRGNGQGSLFERKAGGPWIASWYDHGGKRREKSTKTTDKASAQRLVTKWTTGVALRREGVIDVYAEALAKQR
jgi:hypothetical protein